MSMPKSLLFLVVGVAVLLCNRRGCGCGQRHQYCIKNWNEINARRTDHSFGTSLPELVTSVVANPAENEVDIDSWKCDQLEYF